MLELTCKTYNAYSEEAGEIRPTGTIKDCITYEAHLRLSSCLIYFNYCILFLDSYSVY